MKKTTINKQNAVKIGSVLISLFDGKPFIITGGVDGQSSGPAHLASLLYGWNYTGKQVMIKNYHNITIDELKELTGGHIDMFSLASTGDVVIEHIELDEMRNRHFKSVEEQINHAFGIPNQSSENKSDDQRIKDGQKNDVHIATIFGLSIERADELLKEYQPMWKRCEEKTTMKLFESLSKKENGIHVEIYPHHINDHFSKYPANEYAFVMFVVGQEFCRLGNAINGFLNSTRGRGLKALFDML